VVADSVERKSGIPGKFVIGMQRPRRGRSGRFDYLNKGVGAGEADDPEVARMIKRCVRNKKTLIATYTYEVLALADVVVVDVQCDYHKDTFGNVRQGARTSSPGGVPENHRREDPTHCMVTDRDHRAPGTTEYVA